jgi:hypothetical protein
MDVHPSMDRPVLIPLVVTRRIRGFKVRSHEIALRPPRHRPKCKKQKEDAEEESDLDEDPGVDREEQYRWKMVPTLGRCCSRSSFLFRCAHMGCYFNKQLIDSRIDSASQL